eukprot:1157489-Pelagomonas_calceolata.AAC.2
MGGSWQVFPHGSTDSLPFATMGSGSLNAMAMFESNYKDDMTREEAIDLVTRYTREEERFSVGTRWLKEDRGWWKRHVGSNMGSHTY